jgi:putative ABC transport system permease protein
MKNCRLAWRNLWRNRRRTLITSSSLFFAVFFAIVMRALQLGAYDRLFRNVIESYTGYIQVQNRDYFDDQVLDNGFFAEKGLEDTLMADPNVSGVLPRIESFALAAAGSRTQGVIVIGTDFSDPSRVSGLFRKDAEFIRSCFEAGDSGKVVTGTGLAEYLHISVGDTLVLIGPGYHGTSAAGKYVLRGTVSLPAPDIDNSVVYLGMESARELYGAPGLTTCMVLSLRKNDDKNIGFTAERLSKKLPPLIGVRSWREMNALLVNQMEADNRSGMLMIGVLYLVIAFGVFGTVLMMMAERRREFAMVISIGMQKRKLAAIVSLEMVFLGLLGIVSGVLASLPLVFYGHFHPIHFTGEMARMYRDYGFEPIMPTLLPGAYYLWQVVVVMIILLIAILFLVRKIFRMNINKALKS